MTLSEEVLQIAVKKKKRSEKQRRRFSHLNAEFQRIAKRDKKAFLSDQRKEIQENNRMGTTRDCFKKIRATKGRFDAKIGAFLVVQTVKCLLAMQEIWVQFLGWEDPLEKEMATHSSILAWKIPWTEEPGRLQSIGSQRVRHD